jgi:hypothetical protein
MLFNHVPCPRCYQLFNHVPCSRCYRVQDVTLFNEVNINLNCCLTCQPTMCTVQPSTRPVRRGGRWFQGWFQRWFQQWFRVDGFNQPTRLPNANRSLMDERSIGQEKFWMHICLSYPPSNFPRFQSLVIN